jgi:hypothetical protein
MSQKIIETHTLRSTNLKRAARAKVFIARRRKIIASDPEGWARQRAVWDAKYQTNHAEGIRDRYVANRDSQLARAKARYAENPVPIIKAAQRRYARLKSKLPHGQVEFPLMQK